MVNVWNKAGSMYYFSEPSNEIDEIPVAVYTLQLTKFGFALNMVCDKFLFDYKIYGLENKLISRVKTSYESTLGNLGILLSGIKGTGKSVTGKQICNELKLPVIIIDQDFPDGPSIPEFLSAIPQDIIVFIDEYEKIFHESAVLLSVMDGVFSNSYRRTFILTTNDVYVNENILSRPSRIRYHKAFKDLDKSVVEEIVDDILIHKDLRDKVLLFISQLEIITVDIVKAVLSEVNIHNEDPELFADVFNVKKLASKANVFTVSYKEGKDPEVKLYKSSVMVNPSRLNDMDYGSSFYIDRKYMGEIVAVLDNNLIEVQSSGYNENDEPIEVTTTYIVEPAIETHYSFKTPIKLTY